MISIIVPVYNAGKFIKETIESVLNQSFTDFELLLIDDVSTDDSEKIIKEIKDTRIRYIKQSENKGAWAARNRGLLEAKGRYIAFLDADDLWDKDKLKKEYEFMQQEDAGFVFTGYEFADEAGKGTGAIVKVPHTLDFKHALNNTNIFTSTVLIDREKIGDDLIKMPHIKSEDTATWWRILMAGNLAYGLNENLVKYRRSAGSLSSDKIEAVRRIWRLYREVAGLNIVSSCLHFVSWAITAVLRRM